MAVGGALFGNGRGGAPASKALVEFRAGKMTVSGSLVSPDKRKGMIQIEQGDDDLMHFKWKDRTSGTVEDDLIIFPDDIDFVRVDQCKTGRVYVLKFKSSSRRMFFWMQEPKDDKDEELCKKVNDSLNKPPPPGSSGGSGGGADLGSLGSALGLSSRGGGVPDLSNLGDSGLQALLSNMSQQQLAQLFGSSVPLRSGGLGGRSRNPASDSSSRTASAASTPAQSSAPAATPAAPKKDSSSNSSAAAAGSATATPTTGGPAAAAAAAAAAPIGLSDLQSVLSGIRVPAGAEGLGAGGSKEPAVDLSVGITGEVIKPLLENPDFISKMKDLLPASEQGESGGDATAAIDSTVKSPQFKQAMAMFSSGLQSGQLAPLIREFDLGDEAVAAAVSGSLEAFVKAVENKNKKGGGAATDADDEMGGLD